MIRAGLVIPTTTRRRRRAEYDEEEKKFKEETSASEETRNMEFRVEGAERRGLVRGSIPLEITRESATILRNTRED